MVYGDPRSRASWASPATNSFYVGPTSNHYQCLPFYIPAMRHFCFSDTWHLHLAHCQAPVTLQLDLSIAVAADLPNVFGGTVPTLTTDKIKHIQAIQQLTAIMAGLRSTPPTVDAPTVRVVAPCPRVVTTPPPMVAIISNNIITPNAIRQIPLVHQHHTRNNNPFQILSDDDNDDDTVVARNYSPSAPPTILPSSIPPLNPFMRHALG